LVLQAEQIAEIAGDGRVNVIALCACAVIQLWCRYWKQPVVSLRVGLWVFPCPWGPWLWPRRAQAPGRGRPAFLSRIGSQCDAPRPGPVSGRSSALAARSSTEPHWCCAG